MAKIEGVMDIETDTVGRTCSFRLEQPDVDYETQLTEFAESNPHLAEFSIQ